MTNQPPEFDLEVSEADFVAARYLNLRPRPWLRVLGIGMLVLYGAILCLGTIQSARTGEAWLVMALLWAVSLFLLWVYFFDVKRTGRRLYRQRKGAKPAWCRLTDEAMESENEHGWTVLPLDHIRKWRENRDLMLLYPSDDLYHIVPKRCLGPELADVLRRRLEERVGPAF